MKKLLLKLIDKTFWKFILVGIINTLFGTAIMFGCYNLLKLNYWVSSAANYILASILSYFLNKYFTFKNKKRSFIQILVFAVNIAMCYLVAYGVAKPLVLWVLSGVSSKIQENIAMLVGMGLFVILNYLGQRLIVFRVDAKAEERRNRKASIEATVVEESIVQEEVIEEKIAEEEKEDVKNEEKKKGN